MNHRISYHGRCLIPVLAWVLYFTLSGTPAYAQSQADRYAMERYEIDAKRMGVDVHSDEALPRSREFLRIDSTYYVGWMFEGVYKYNHAADYNGFRNASIPLERALRLIERDYRKQLSTRTSDLLTYFQIYNYHFDYSLIAHYLMICYSNMEEPEQTVALLQRALKWRFQRDFYMDAYNYLGWTVHRYRFYTSKKYAFLKNSIDENERLAHRYLDSGMVKIRRDMALNKTIFRPGYELPDKLAVYHYKSILHSYAFHIDSAAHYYGLMRKNKALPHSNYATFQVICGNFREAAAEYALEAANRQPDKRLQEWVYYHAMLDIYRGAPTAGIALTKGMIRANGSTPGFGWYNIAQARCLLYDGQYEEALRYITKAETFRELHIGTTLGQTHYDFSLQLLKLKHKLQERAAQQFEHKNWWYNPVVLGKMAKLSTDKYLQQFLIINQFAQNPERDRVIYKLFSTESTVSWEEIWLLIRDFSTGFFLQKFQQELNTDPRKNIHRYYKFFIARLQMQQGHYREAGILLNEILLDPTIDTDYEKLLVAQVLQAQATCALKEDKMSIFYNRMSNMYRHYPQLIPYSSLQMGLRLTATGTVPQKMLNRLRAMHINWNPPGGVQVPEVQLLFSGTGGKQQVTYSVRDTDGSYLLSPQTMTFADEEKDAVQLAYRLFGIGEKTAEERGD